MSALYVVCRDAALSATLYEREIDASLRPATIVNSAGVVRLLCWRDESTRGRRSEEGEIRRRLAEGNGLLGRSWRRSCIRDRYGSDVDCGGRPSTGDDMSLTAT